MNNDQKTILQHAMETDTISVLVSALTAAGLAETFSGTGPFTVFAPNNDAFKKLPDGILETLLLPENKAKLVSILTYHVVPGQWKASDIAEGESTIKTLQGSELKITKKDSMVWVNASQVLIADMLASNGVIHIIDSVLMPQ